MWLLLQPWVGGQPGAAGAPSTQTNGLLLSGPLRCSPGWLGVVSVLGGSEEQRGQSAKATCSPGSDGENKGGLNKNTRREPEGLCARAGPWQGSLDHVCQASTIRCLPSDGAR